MRQINRIETKESGQRWVSVGFRVETPAGTADFYFSGAFYRGYTDLSIGIQGNSTNGWKIPDGYSFFVEGFGHDLVNPDFDGKRELNIVHPQIIQENKTNTASARLVTPYGDVLFDIEIHSTHRRQYVAVKSSEIPSGIQIDKYDI